MNIYDKLKIEQNTGGGIDLYLDDKRIEGCTDASLDLSVGSLPKLTITVLVKKVDVVLDAPIDTTVTYEEECV